MEHSFLSLVTAGRKNLWKILNHMNMNLHTFAAL